MVTACDEISGSNGTPLGWAPPDEVPIPDVSCDNAVYYWAPYTVIYVVPAFGCV